MGRPLEPEKREDLLDRSVDYVLKNGLADLSLRPLAAYLSTSPRMLLYHFGSKEQLIASILTRARQRLIGSITSDPRALPDSWRRLRSRSMTEYWRLLLQVYALGVAGVNPYALLLRQAVREWMRVVPGDVDEETRTLVIAAVGGLLLDLVATGDVKRVDRAAARLFAMIGPSCEGETS